MARKIAKLSPDTITATDAAALLPGMKEMTVEEAFAPAMVRAFNQRDCLGVHVNGETGKYFVSFERQGAGPVFEIRTKGTDGVLRHYRAGI